MHRSRALAVVLVSSLAVVLGCPTDPSSGSGSKDAGLDGNDRIVFVCRHRPRAAAEYWRWDQLHRDRNGHDHRRQQRELLDHLSGAHMQRVHHDRVDRGDPHQQISQRHPRGDDLRRRLFLPATDAKSGDRERHVQRYQLLGGESGWRERSRSRTRSHCWAK